MAAVSAFAYTSLTARKMSDSRYIRTFTLATGSGNTSGTYPAGGIPLSTSSLGLPYGQLDTLDILDQSGDGYVYTWNKTNSKIQMFQQNGTTGVLVEITSSVSPTVALTVEVKGY